MMLVLIFWGLVAMLEIEYKLSVIVPCFNEQDSVDIFYKEIINYLHDLHSLYEIIFIDDGSRDNTLEKIKNLSELDNNVKYISFSRNFGKEAALYAGLKKSEGDYVVVMDVDLQDPPKLLPKMLEIIQNCEYDIVGTRRVSRKGEPVIRSFFARLFYKFINAVSDIKLVDGARDYRLMTRQVTDSILELDEYNRFSKGLFTWVGFKTYWIEYENIERAVGETSWSFWGLLKYSIEAIVSFSTVPLSLSTFFGVLFSLVSFVAILFIILKNLLYSNPVPGWPSTVCLILFVSGIQLISIGILGKYLEKTYIETKNRPIFIIKETNLDE